MPIPTPVRRLFSILAALSMTLYPLAALAQEAPVPIGGPLEGPPGTPPGAGAPFPAPATPTSFAQAARSESTIKSRVIGTASRLVDRSN